MSTYRTLIARIHPKTRKCRGFGLIPHDTRYIVGKRDDCAHFSDLSSAIRYHAIVTGSSADFVHVRLDRTAPMNSGRLTLLGHVTADGDKQGSARGSQVDYSKGEVEVW